MLSEDPKKRPRFSEIISQLKTIPNEKPDEIKFVDIFKGELNTIKGIEFQQNLFELFESFPIFYFNGDFKDAERILEEIQKLLSLKENVSSEVLNKSKIFRGDIFVCQKKFDLAEQEY